MKLYTFRRLARSGELARRLVRVQVALGAGFATQGLLLLGMLHLGETLVARHMMIGAVLLPWIFIVVALPACVTAAVALVRPGVACFTVRSAIMLACAMLAAGLAVVGPLVRAGWPSISGAFLVITVLASLVAIWLTCRVMRRG